MKLLILAAGYATRLYPLTLDKPKPLLKIGGKPIVEHILEKAKNIEEINEVFIVTNNKFYKNFLEWQDAFSYHVPVKIINDKTETNESRLGAVGDIDFVIRSDNIDEDLIVIAGDNLFEFNFTNFINFYKEKKSTIVALIDLKEKEKLANTFGTVLLDENKKVINFEEKPKDPKSTLAATACYIFTKEDLTELKKCMDENKKPDNSGDFVNYISQKKDVFGWVFEERWWDIGSKEQLEEVRHKYGG